MSHDAGTESTISGDDSASHHEATPAAMRLGKLERGTSLGRYIVLDRLGGGGMGVVYSAFDPELDRRIAIKLLRPKVGGAATEGRQRLLREAQALARLSHPNVIAVHDVGTLGEEVFVAMEYVDGTTLHAWVKDHAREWTEVRDMYVHAGRGLAAAHAVGIVHRDFKPENVLVGNDGRPRVLDFGLARAEIGGPPPDPDLPIDSADTLAPSTPGLGTPLTRAGAFMGTPAYCSPEQLQNIAADARSDQFSFCVSLYEALYGERPFAGATLTKLAMAIAGGDVRAAPADTPVPAHVRASLLRGLRAKPDERFPAMNALLDALVRDPAARRRRALSIAAGGVLLAAAVTAAPLLPAQHSSVCDGERAPIATSPALAGYAARWTQLAVQSCEATRVRGEQSQELYEARAFCLARRRAALDATARIVASVPGHAPDIAAQLDPLDDCADAAQLRAAGTPPTSRQAILQLEERLAAARALALADKPAEARAQLPEVADAQATGYRPLVAKVRLARGWLEARTGEASATATLTDAVLEAEATPDAALQAEAWLELMIAERARGHEPQAQRASEHVAALLTRLPGHGVLAQRYAAALR